MTKTTMTETKSLTRHEREDLLRIIRSRDETLKTAAAARAAELKASFEAAPPPQRASQAIAGSRGPHPTNRITREMLTARRPAP